MKMKLTVGADAHVCSKQVEKKFEMLLEECNTERFTLIGMPLEQLPLTCDGLPLILQKIYDYIINYGLYDECLFDDAYSKNGCGESILNAYELVSSSGQSCKTILDVDAVDVGTVLVMWLYYLPKPLVSLKQFSMICDMETNTKYQEILKPMDIVNQLTLQRVMQILDSYEKQHKGYKEKLGSLFTLLLTKHVDVACQDNAFLFLDNLKTILMESKIKHDAIKTYLDKDENVFNNNKNLCDEENQFRRSLSDDGLQLKAGPTIVYSAATCHTLKRPISCNLVNVPFIFKENDDYKSFTNNLSINEENDYLKTKPIDQFSGNLFQESSICEIDELMYDAQIEDMRNVERTMPTHLKNSVKRNKKKSIRSHVDTVIQTGFLSFEDSILLQNTLELMKILSKIKNVQNQINIQKKILEDKLVENEDANKHFSELHFLNHRFEKLVNQKMNYLARTGLPYGKSYNRTVLNLKNAQKEAFKLQDEEKNNKNSQYENMDRLISDIYNIQIVLDYLQNNCGGKELPWRSSKGLGNKRKIKNQLNCVTVVSDLQTIGEHEVMENTPKLLFKTVEHSDMH